MKQKIKKYLKEAVVFVVLLIVVSNGVSYMRSSDLKLDDALCENGVDIVHFWALWCPVCKTEAPNIDALAKKYTLKSIVVGSPKEKVQAYMEQNGYSFSVYYDETSTLARQNNITVFPTTIVCADAKVFYSDVGYTSELGLEFRIWLARLFAMLD